MPHPPSTRAHNGHTNIVPPAPACLKRQPKTRVGMAPASLRGSAWRANGKRGITHPYELRALTRESKSALDKSRKLELRSTKLDRHSNGENLHTRQQSTIQTTSMTAPFEFQEPLALGVCGHVHRECLHNSARVGIADGAVVQLTGSKASARIAST